MASKRKVIITVAQTGNFQGKAANPSSARAAVGDRLLGI